MSAENKETRPRSKQIEAKTKTEQEEGRNEDAVSSAFTGRSDEHKTGPRASERAKATAAEEEKTHENFVLIGSPAK